MNFQDAIDFQRTKNLLIKFFILNDDQVIYLVIKKKSIKYHSIIFDTTPAPIVRPPSLIANRIPCSIATGQINSPVI